MSTSVDHKPHYILNATCDSRLGTVAAVSGFLASRQCYITEMQQFDDMISGRLPRPTVIWWCWRVRCRCCQTICAASCAAGP